MAPNVAGTNCLTQAEDALVELLANLPAFQEFIGATPGDADGSRDRIYVHDIPETTATDRDAWTVNEWLARFPCGLIMQALDGESFSFDQHARDDRERFVANLRYTMIFEDYANINFDVQDQARWFLNHVGNILEQITEVSGLTAGQFAPMAISVAAPMHRHPYARYEELGEVLSMGFHLERFVEG